jgi:hypothetical protein
MGPPVWQSVATIAVSCLTALIAFAVYRVQSEKLFVDTFRLRLDALNEVIRSAHARIKESETYKLINQSPEDEALRQFWQGMDAARPLFGADFGEAVDNLERALREFDLAYVQFIEAHYDEPASRLPKIRAKADRLQEAYAMIKRLSDVAQPYIALGTRGLSWRQRLSIQARRCGRLLKAAFWDFR